MFEPPVGFNPCFDGSVARASCFSSRAIYEPCFNPCFDGSVARGSSGSLNPPGLFRFQSLF